ncbi:AAA family ATPase [bacterium]|nr:AAA family ATPase [bacterium]
MINLDCLDSDQRLAVERCLDIKRRIVPVTGQAGSGKTSIMKIVFDKYIHAGYRVVMCAPTGKAAKRIHEATGIPAMTIHRLLEYPHPGERDEKGKPLSTTVPKRDRNNPLEYNVVLADEYAMVNTEVHRNLIDALPRAGVLRAFGDINQLPPIEPGNREMPSPFSQMLKNFDGVVLGTIHRQGEGSGIVSNGNLILKGQMPKRLSDFTFTITDDPVTSLREHVLSCDKDFGKMDAQIISPTNKGRVGVIELNNTMQRLYKPENVQRGLLLPRHKWDVKKAYRIGVGDKVIWTQNNYDLEIFNGETGVVVEITDLDEIAIDFGDRVETVPPEVNTVKRDGTLGTYDPRKDLDLAYVVTTHKSQGSEYQDVIYVLNRSSVYIQNRQNFYTAITRARKSAHLITDKFSLGYSVQHKRMVI